MLTPSLNQEAFINWSTWYPSAVYEEDHVHRTSDWSTGMNCCIEKKLGPNDFFAFAVIVIGIQKVLFSSRLFASSKD